MWYVIQTITGKEEELISLIGTILNKELYDDCFVIKAEWLKRLGGQWQLQVRTMFPGYVFIDTDKADTLFIKLKIVPKFTKLLGDGESQFVPLETEEEVFLRKILGDRGHIVHLSDVVISSDGKIIGMGGPLMCMRERIQQINLHKRYAVVETRIMGVVKTAILGVRLKRNE